MKRYSTSLIIIAILVVGGIRIFHSFTPIEETDEVVLTDNTSQIDIGKAGHQTRLDAKTKQAEPAAKVAKRDSKRHSSEIKQVLVDDLETRFLNAASFGHEIESLKTEIITRLNQGDAATLQWIERALGSSEPRTQRHLIDVLGQAESSEALEALLQFAQAADVKKGDPRIPALRAIAELKHLEKASEKSRDAASAMLQQYLESASEDTKILYAVASGISKLGRPEGISKLIGLLETRPEHTGIIANALNNARSPEAISQLKDRLLQDPELSNQASKMIGSTLGAIGTPQAVSALLDLASQAQGEEARQVIFAWLSQINDESSIQLLFSAQDTYRFADPQFGLQLQELGKQMDNSPLMPMPLLAGMPKGSNLAATPQR